MHIAPYALRALQPIRQSLYVQLGKAKDAVFELMDAAMVSTSIPPFAACPKVLCFDSNG